MPAETFALCPLFKCNQSAFNNRYDYVDTLCNAMKHIIGAYWRMKEVGSKFKIKFGEMIINTDTDRLEDLFRTFKKEIEEPEFFTFSNMRPWQLVEEWKRHI